MSEWYVAQEKFAVGDGQLVQVPFDLLSGAYKEMDEARSKYASLAKTETGGGIVILKVDRPVSAEVVWGE